VRVAEGAEAPTVTTVWKTANWMEREVFDMFGVYFAGHPTSSASSPGRVQRSPAPQGLPDRGIDTGAAIYPDVYPPAAAGERRRGGSMSERAPCTSPRQRGDGDLLRPPASATHGVLRVMVKVDGERIVETKPVIGYLHRGTEKIFERETYNGCIPHTDRLDYTAAATNNQAWSARSRR